MRNQQPIVCCRLLSILAHVGVAFATLMCFGDVVGAIGPPIETICLPSGTGEIRLTFIAVPAGSVTLGTPDEDVRQENLGLTYLFMTTEVSLAQFEALAPEQTVLERRRRAEAIATTPEQKRILEEMARRGDKYAAQMLTIDEIGALTARLNSLYRAGKQADHPLVTWRFRLPTTWEWQHAMSLGSQPDSRDINPWPRYSDDFSEKEKTILEAKWRAAGGTGGFAGTQKQVRTLMAECPKPEDGILLLNMFFREMLQGRSGNSDSEEQTAGSWSEPPNELAETLTAGNANSWGLFGAHRGYPEWTLSGAIGQQEALATWRRIENGAATDADRRKPLFQLSGGHGICIDDTDLSPLCALFIWHERKTSEGKSLLTQEEAEDKAVDFSAVGRLVLVECLSDDWQRIVRGSFMDDGAVETAQEQADRFIADLTKFSAQVLRDKAYVDIYCGITEYRNNNRAGFANRLLVNASVFTDTKSQGLSRDELLGRGKKPGQARKQQPAPNTVYLQALAKLVAHDDEE